MAELSTEAAHGPTPLQQFVLPSHLQAIWRATVVLMIAHASSFILQQSLCSVRNDSRRGGAGKVGGTGLDPKIRLETHNSLALLPPGICMAVVMSQLHNHLVADIPGFKRPRIYDRGAVQAEAQVS
jgi:hypothetical protein